MRVTPRVAEAAEAVRAMIAGGTLKPGDRTPTASALHKQTGVSVVRCLLALRFLVDEGVLYPLTSAHGKLWIVADPGQSPQASGQANFLFACAFGNESSVPEPRSQDAALAEQRNRSADGVLGHSSLIGHPLLRRQPGTGRELACGYRVLNALGNLLADQRVRPLRYPAPVWHPAYVARGLASSLMQADAPGYQ